MTPNCSSSPFILALRLVASEKIIVPVPVPVADSYSPGATGEGLKGLASVLDSELPGQADSGDATSHLLHPRRELRVADRPFRRISRVLLGGDEIDVSVEGKLPFLAQPR